MSLTGESRCCPLGSNCLSDSQCNSQSYQCTRTVPALPYSTLPFVGHPPPAGNSTEVGCCGRQCPQSRQYLCPTELGGNCCPYGSDCQSDGNCISTVTTTLLNAPSSSWSVMPTVQPTADAGTSGGMSTATKTGVAVAVVGGAGVVFGIATWLFMTRKRRNKKEQEHAETENEGSDERGGGYFDVGATTRAVPSQPQTPGDIITPVEMGTTVPKIETPRPETLHQEMAESSIVYELDATETQMIPAPQQRGDEEGHDLEIHL